MCCQIDFEMMDNTLIAKSTSFLIIWRKEKRLGDYSSLTIASHRVHLFRFIDVGDCFSHNSLSGMDAINVKAEVVKLMEDVTTP